MLYTSFETVVNFIAKSHSSIIVKHHLYSVACLIQISFTQIRDFRHLLITDWYFLTSIGTFGLCPPHRHTHRDAHLHGHLHTYAFTHKHIHSHTHAPHTHTHTDAHLSATIDPILGQPWLAFALLLYKPLAAMFIYFFFFLSQSMQRVLAYPSSLTF